MPTKEKIGVYEVQKSLGRGGMGEVFLGYHPTLERYVAIKKLSPRVQKQNNRIELLQRFFREGKVLAQLRHQSIVQVYELVVSEPDVYMVLEYVYGCDLATILKKGGLVPSDIGVILARQLAAALDNAHFNGVIHRDIKPGNVMVSNSGEIKLMDFGIAKEMEGQDLTATGMLVGTPSFMAPERLAGAEGDDRSDIFSLGVLLYQALSGEHPFHAPKLVESIRRIKTGQFSPLRKVMSHIPKQLSDIVDHCLATNPSHRYQTAGELEEACALFLARHASFKNHPARMIAFLYDRGHITEQEALARVDERTLEFARRVVIKKSLFDF